MSAPGVAAEPWADADPAEPAERYEIGAIGVAADAEYRSMYTFINPITLNSEEHRNYNALEHRLRFSGIFDWDETVKLNMSIDAFDGVLWGDNGTFGGDPSSDSGLQVTTKDPNNVKACIKWDGEGDRLQPSSYSYGLCEADLIRLRRLYGQVTTPIGALRVGRQPVSTGMTVQVATGDGRKNRFGVAYEGDYVDRVLFATKPLEAFKPEGARNTSETEGLITAILYDRWVSDTAHIWGDDVHQVGTGIVYREPDLGFVEDFNFQLSYVHRWNQRYGTKVHSVAGRSMARLGDVHVGVDMCSNFGTTREVSDAYSVITSDPIVDQEILQYAARGVVRYDQPMWTAYMEVDYASGDGDPLARTPLSAVTFSYDTNVGLLLFEHILRYQSARAAAAGVEIIRQLGAETFPAERVHTRGAFTNTFALFPQFDVRPHEDLLFRLGALFAWAPEPVIDPVASLQANDGATIEDDLVNFVGGKPGDFYGIELDGRFQWRFVEHFALDLEGAILFPGDALQDVNGDAVNSYLTQARATVFF